MRAVVHDRYGPPEVLRLAAVDRPEPDEDELLVRVHATTVNRTDCSFRQAKPFFVRAFSGVVRPRRRILGSEFAGEVVDVGSAVGRFRVRDEVFGVSADRFGAHADYICVREHAPVAHKPAGMSFVDAAAVCDGMILARTLLRWADVRSGQRVLVYGASGSIGTAAVQLARHLGAEVTAVCTTKNVDLIGSLGAEAVIDYTREDFTRSGETYDVVVDAVGKHSYWRCKRSLAKGGTYVATDLGFLWQNPFLALWTWRIGDTRVLMPIPRYTREDVEFLKQLIEAGEYRAVVDRWYPLEQVVEATRYVETEQKTGNVVMQLTGASFTSVSPVGDSPPTH